MANEEQLALIQQGTEAWNAWRAILPKVPRGGAIGPRLDLSNANLSNANLSKALSELYPCNISTLANLGSRR